MSTIVKTIAILTARPGKVEALAGLLHNMIPHCRAEPGPPEAPRTPAIPPRCCTDSREEPEGVSDHDANC